MLGWWLGSILFIIIWVAIAFWPARVAAPHEAAQRRERLDSTMQEADRLVA